MHRIMRLLFIFCFFLVPLTVNACPHNTCVRIGTWNIAWLGSEKREQASDTETINAMADMIAHQWSIDLIALEEINTVIDGKFHGENYTTRSWQTLRKALEKNGYQTAAGESGGAQHIVLAWRKPVTLEITAQDMNIPDSYSIGDYCHSANLRRPLAGQFKAGKFDFWIVALHLKSGYGNQTHCTDDIRNLQAHYLIKALPALEKSDKDIIVIGDFNATGNHKSLAELKSHGLLALTDKDNRTAESHTRTQGKGKQGKVIDHIMVNPDATREWQKRSTGIFKPDDAASFTQRYSDHYPVWADFNTGQDDD